MKLKKTFYLGIFTMFGGLSGCDALSGVGACVSTIVDYYSFSANYCYSNYTAAECAERDSLNVNGADWFFYAGQTCADRGLNEGSNYY